MVKHGIAFLAALMALAALPAVAAEEYDIDQISDSIPEASASDDADEGAGADAYPISASFGVLYRFNHANFVATESDATDFGYQFMRFSASVSYEIIESLSLDLGLSADKEIGKSYNRPAIGGGAVAGGPSNRKLYGTEVRDATLGATWADFYTIPVVDISFTAALTAYLPFSRSSRAVGMITALSPEIAAGWKLGGFSADLGVAELYYINESATVQVDCSAAPENCTISGKDATVVNSLHDLSTYLTLGYQIIDPLKVSGTYAIGNTWSAAKFPQDEFTSEYAQDGTQDAAGYHYTQFIVSYKVFDKTTVKADMLTLRALNTNDGKSTTVPLFDFDSNLAHRTRYSVAVSQAF